MSDGVAPVVVGLRFYVEGTYHLEPMTYNGFRRTESA